MKKLTLLIFPVSIFLIQACSKCAGGGAPSEELLGKDYGLFELTSAGKQWMTDSLDDLVTYKSGKGYVVDYKLTRNDSQEYQSQIASRYIEKECGHDYEIDVARFQSRDIRYEPTKSTFDIAYSINVYVPRIEELANIDPKDTKDQIYINMASGQFFLVPHESQTYNETIELGGREFNKVYLVEKSPANDIGLYLRWIYVTLEEGVIAFKFSDNELWVKQN